jgi:hypothetical protein
MGFQRLNLFCLKLGLATGIKRHVEMIDWKFVGNVCFVKYIIYACMKPLQNVFLMKLRADALKLLTKAIFCPDFDLPN